MRKIATALALAAGISLTAGAIATPALADIDLRFNFGPPAYYGPYYGYRPYYYQPYYYSPYYGPHYYRYYR